MAKGTKSKIKVGIAIESTFGVDPGAADFVLPADDFTVDPIIESVRNEALLGSRYSANDAQVAQIGSAISGTIKWDVESLPAFLKLFGTISSAAAPGETVVYKHDLTWSDSNTPVSFTFYIDDPDRGDQIVTGVIIDDFNPTIMKKEYAKFSITGKGKFPVSGTVSLAVSSVFREFVGKHATLKMVDEGGSLAEITVLEASLSHSFNGTDDEDNYALGDEDMTWGGHRDAEFEHELKLHFEDYTYRDDAKNNQHKHLQITMEDTSAILTGSVASTYPKVVVDYPSAYLNFKQEGGRSDILKQTVTVVPLDKPGIANAPCTWSVYNTTASYS